MTTTAVSLDKYLARSMTTVPGFLSSLDARLIHGLLSYQAENNIPGHLCEIGVHHGRLFLMLALARQAGERALAVDLFEDDPLNVNTPHAGRNRALVENAERLGIALSEQEIFKTSSLVIGPNDIVARTTGPVRFFSVDGGHLYQHVANDLRLAQQTLSDEGIIAVDDFFNIGWADVSFATYDFLRETTTVVPFAVTSVKIYLAPIHAAKRYRKALANRTDLGDPSTVQIVGNEVIALRQSALKRGYEFVRDAIARAAS